MAGIRGVSLAWLLFPVAGVLLLGGCRRSTHCPEGWREEAVGNPATGYWCRTPKANTTQYKQVHPQNGRVRQVCNYTAGRPDGPFEAYHPDGKRWIEGQYANGRLHGPWTQWDDRGAKVVAGEYREGALISGAPVGIAAVCELVLSKK